jgi:hypothetical protein
MKKGEEMIGKNREEERKVGRKGCAWWAYEAGFFLMNAYEFRCIT